ncbi:group II truncated hemoglobin [Aestuariibacter sp. A3R04]|uniref:group II truncated hemoglobin n=1 Tax=Aestuariibacter sp. A3R04 TaxID=2841571 RepID=UPI001C095E44|nr:group II truncated hemoglobin [Aestuariibacter sp. A3R04]MBU3020183.1 group II truncated hemoglobin [Aestuariibacter sp. A3R04]
MSILGYFNKMKEKKRRYKTPTTPYELIGGDAKVTQLANKFYDIMEQDPFAAELLALHPKPLDRIRHVFTLYLIMWLGGPNNYELQFGHPRLRARHLPFSVTPELKRQWMYCMRKAMMDTVTDISLAEKLLHSLDQLAEHMINTD